MSVRRLVAVVLLWASGLLVVAGVAIRVSGVLPLPLQLWIGAGLFVLGLHVLIAGDLVVTAGIKPYSARAQVSRAVLEVASGVSDVLVVASQDFSRLAAVRLGPDARSDLEIVDGVAHLRLTRRVGWLPGSPPWRARLADNVLWDVKARSLLGNLDIDLREMRVDTVSLKSTLGGVRVICPRRGRPLLELETRVGDLEVVLPRDVGAQVRLERGRMANVDLDEELFEQVDRDTYTTHDLDNAGTMAEITLRIQVGDARVSRD